MHDQRLQDVSGYVSFISLFKQADLEQALFERDWAKVSSFAHKIKPTFSYIGREDAKDHMQMIEHNARDLNDVEGLATAFEELTAFTKVLYTQLDAAKADLEKQL